MHFCNFVECFERYCLFTECIIRHCGHESSLLIALCKLLQRIVFKYIYFASHVYLILSNKYFLVIRNPKNIPFYYEADSFQIKL